MQRRQFLGAAAVLSGIPVSASDVAADGGSDDANEDDGDDEPDYGRNTVVKTSGGLEVWTEGNNETKFQVSSHPEGIGLKLSNQLGQMSVLLLPEDIEPLCWELLDAKAKTQPEEVEYSREWITEDFRGGDTDKRRQDLFGRVPRYEPHARCSLVGTRSAGGGRLRVRGSAIRVRRA
jgi:hypothetical protein